MARALAFSTIGGILKLTRFDKPIGIFLLLWPTLWGLWIAAEGAPSWDIFKVFVLGVVLMRAAGCAINDFADRGIDGRVKRTKARPLVTGEVSPAVAIAVFCSLSMMAFVLVLTLNTLTIQLSFGAMALAMVYPFLKRYTYLPQLVLGAAFAWAIPMGFAAITNAVPETAWILFIATLLWTTAYDTMYAMVDREYDKSIGVKSTAILFGEADVAFIACLFFMVLAALTLVGLRLELHEYYFYSLGIALGMVGYQLWLIKDRDPDKCFRAFISNNWFGMIIFLGLVAAYGQKVDVTP